MAYLRIKQAAEILGIAPVTLRKWCEQGKIQYDRSVAGERIFSPEYILNFRNEKLGIVIEKKKVFYVRASDSDNVKIETQKEILKSKFGEPDKIFSDKASGLNDNRTGLNSLIKYAQQTKNLEIYITNKDRLTRFGYNYLEQLFSMVDSEIIALEDPATKEPHEVLLQDFMSLIASFSGKFYRLRGWKQQKQFVDQIKAQVDKNAQK